MAELVGNPADRVDYPRVKVNRFEADELSAIDAHSFFSRKVCLAKYSSAFIYMPGGFGTMDEFFEILTLVQTRKIPRFPLILYGKDYWRGLFRWINSTLKKGRYISPKDTDLVTLTDDTDEAVEVISEWHKRRTPQHTPPMVYL